MPIVKMSIVNVPPKERDCSAPPWDRRYQPRRCLVSCCYLMNVKYGQHGNFTTAQVTHSDKTVAGGFLVEEAQVFGLAFHTQ